MKLIYTHENKIIVENTRNYLSECGIDSEMRNEFACGAIGDLSPIQTWPELWVSENDFTQAKKLIDSIVNSTDPSWSCTQCGEENDASFEFCWNCRCERPQ